MDQSEKDQLLESFCNVSGVPKERAVFFLESSDWQVNVALSNFYESGAGAEDEDVAVAMEESMAAPQSAPIASAAPNDPPSGAGPQQNISTIKSKPTSGTRQPRSRNFTSIHDYKNKEEENSSDDGEEGQQFYAGGSEHSGNMIVGPKKKMSNDAITSNLFAQAKKHGAEVVEGEDSPTSSRSQTKYFQGSGYRLGDSTTPATTERVGGTAKPAPKKPSNVILRLWSNGFTVGDGELRSFQDQANAEFLRSITIGQIPQELLNEDGTEVHVNMEDHRNEEYEKPKAKMVAFSGQGYTLGSTSSSMDVSSAPAAPTQSSNVDPVVVDDSKPKTTLQIRLKDGSRIRKEFNHSHTVGDVIAAVTSASATDNFVLMTTFPNRQLTDTKQTLAEANLLNSMVVQKMV